MLLKEPTTALLQQHPTDNHCVGGFIYSIITSSLTSLMRLAFRAPKPHPNSPFDLTTDKASELRPSEPLLSLARIGLFFFVVELPVPGSVVVRVGEAQPKLEALKTGVYQVPPRVGALMCAIHVKPVRSATIKGVQGCVDVGLGFVMGQKASGFSVDKEGRAGYHR